MTGTSRQNGGSGQVYNCPQCSNIDALGFCEGIHLPGCIHYAGPPRPEPSGIARALGWVLRALRVT